MNRGFVVREYRKEDDDAIFEVHIKALSDTGADMGDKTRRYGDLKDIAANYASGVFLVVTQHERIVAIGGLKYISERQRFEIKRMRVLPDYQRQGLGQVLLSTLEAYARSQKSKELFLDTTEYQVSAQKFYMKNGYREFARGDIHNQPSIYYSKVL